MAVNIEGLDQRKLLRALWENTRPCSFFRRYPEIPPPYYNEDEVDKMITDGKVWVDYLFGRCIKISLKDKQVNPAFYDEDAGEGTFERVVAILRTIV